MDCKSGVAECNNVFNEFKIKGKPLSAEYFLLDSFFKRRIGEENATKKIIRKNYHQAERFIANHTNVKLWHEADRIEIIKALYGVQFTQIPENFVIFAMPKSGSTSLHRMMASCLQGNMINGDNINSENDFSLDPFLFLNCLGDPRAIVKSHTICTQRIMAILNLTNVRPIILFRNIEDCLNSMASHFSSGREAEKYGFHHLNSSEKNDFIILKYSYAYHQFLKSWRLASFKSPVKYLHYENTFSNISQELYNIFATFGFEISDDYIKNAIHEIEMLKTISPKEIRFSQNVLHNPNKLSINKYKSFQQLFEKLK